MVIADVLSDKNLATAETLAGRGFDISACTVDLENADSIRACAHSAVQMLGGLDALINNGAIATGIGGITGEEIDVDTWDRVMRVNVRGTWLMSTSCLPALRESGNGKILNIASDTALWGAPRLMHYVASKGAVIAMTRAMAREVGVLAVPGTVFGPDQERFLRFAFANLPGEDVPRLIQRLEEVPRRLATLAA